MQSEVITVAESLTKKFGNLLAVDSIDLRVFKSECFGFLWLLVTTLFFFVLSVNMMKERLVK